MIDFMTDAKVRVPTKEASKVKKRTIIHSDKSHLHLLTMGLPFHFENRTGNTPATSLIWILTRTATTLGLMAG
jgi:hypothetical protein